LEPRSSECRRANVNGSVTPATSISPQSSEPGWAGCLRAASATLRFSLRVYADRGLLSGKMSNYNRGNLLLGEGDA
jgi:hypothetical protein